MMRKTLLIGALMLSAGLTASAQDFTLHHDTMSVNTQGVPAPQNWDDDAILMHNYVFNETSAAVTLNWQIVRKTLPIGWSVYGFCDNINCRPSSHPAVTANAAQETAPIAVGDSSLLEPRFAVPVDADNGVGILRVHIWQGTTHDTATYIVNKTGTSISKINIGDSRVALYPNPTSKYLQVYADKSLNVNKVSIFNIVGKKELTVDVKAGTEIMDINVNALAGGLYMVQLTDANGKLVTSRKFTKN